MTIFTRRTLLVVVTLVLVFSAQGVASAPVLPNPVLYFLGPGPHRSACRTRKPYHPPLARGLSLGLSALEPKPGLTFKSEAQGALAGIRPNAAGNRPSRADSTCAGSFGSGDPPSSAPRRMAASATKRAIGPAVSWSAVIGITP